MPHWLGGPFTHDGNAVHHSALGGERERLWQIGTGINPVWTKYQTQTERALPVVVLTPDPQSAKY